MKKPIWTALPRSLQAKLALSYSVLILILVILMNTFPISTTESLLSHTKQTHLQQQATLLRNALRQEDRLTGEAVEQAIRVLELTEVVQMDVTRIVVTNPSGQVIYDSVIRSRVGSYLLTTETVATLNGTDRFFSDFSNGVYSSRITICVSGPDGPMGVVCLYDRDSDMGELLDGLKQKLRIISLVVCLAMLALFMVFSLLLTSKVNRLLTGIRSARAGEYSHRIVIGGNDELSDLAEEFNQLTLRLQTTEEERKRFVSDASHELKTPLAFIRLMVDTIRQGKGIDRETGMRFVENIGEATDRLIHISEELLELNTLDECQKRTSEPVDLAARVRAIRRMLDPLAKEYKVTLFTELPEGCVVRCSQNDADQIIRNLMENGIKYNVPHGSVRVSLRHLEDAVLMEVSDTGIGIPQEDLDRVFDRFYRVDKARSRAAGGSGLGLSIVRDAVRLHGGEISVRHREKGGTCFTVTLPVWSGEADPGKECVS